MSKASIYCKLALGVLLASGVNMAQADLTPVALTNGNTTDLVFTAWDPIAQDSYAVDLNLDIQSFWSAAGSTNYTWDLDSQFSSFAAAGNPITFNLAAENWVTPPAGITNDSLLETFQTGSTKQTIKPEYIYMFENQNIVQGYFQTVANAGGQEVFTSAQSGYFVDQSGDWGTGQGSPSTNHSTIFGGGGVDELTAVYYHTTGASPGTGSTAVSLTDSTGYFSISQSGSNYYLNWTSNVSAVPVPGAVWLFLGGLMSMLGLQKRKSSSAV